MYNFKSILYVGEFIRLGFLFIRPFVGECLFVFSHTAASNMPPYITLGGDFLYFLVIRVN